MISSNKFFDCFIIPGSYSDMTVAGIHFLFFRDILNLLHICITRQDNTVGNSYWC